VNEPVEGIEFMEGIETDDISKEDSKSWLPCSSTEIH